MERALGNPELKLPDPTDPTLERRYRKIPEHEKRVAGGGQHDSCPGTGGERILRSHDERQSMKLKVDREADALYLRLDDSPIVDSEEVSPGVVLDFNGQNQVVGIEMLNLSKRAPQLNHRLLSS
jgi:uncharacterized protein YuzE